MLGSAEYVKRMQARVRFALDTATAEGAPAFVLDTLKNAQMSLETATPDARPSWHALDVFRRWRLGLASYTGSR